jgi:hypothetical protein
MAWYAGHLYLMRLLAEQVSQREGNCARPKPRSDPRLDERLKADMVALLEQDLLISGVRWFSPRPIKNQSAPRPNAGKVANTAYISYEQAMLNLAESIRGYITVSSSQAGSKTANRPRPF